LTFNGISVYDGIGEYLDIGFLFLLVLFVFGNIRV